MLINKKKSRCCYQNLNPCFCLYCWQDLVRGIPLPRDFVTGELIILDLSWIIFLNHLDNPWKIEENFRVSQDNTVIYESLTIDLSNDTRRFTAVTCDLGSGIEFVKSEKDAK